MTGVVLVFALIFLLFAGSEHVGSTLIPIVRGVGVAPATSLELTGGESRSLILAAERLKTAPPFGLPGTDPERLYTSVARFKEIAQTIVAKDPAAAYAFPIPFLEALVALEINRHTFLKNPDEAGLRAYRRALLIAAYEYRKNVRAHVRAWQRVTPADMPARRTLSRAITRTSMERFYTALERVADSKVRRARQFNLCIAGYTRACTTLPEAPDSFAPLAAEPSSKELETAARILRVWDVVRSPLDPAHEDLVYLSARCTAAPGPFFYALARSDENHPSRRPIRDVGDLLFLRLTKPAESFQNPFMRFLRGEGLSLLHLTPTAFYLCPEAAHDIGRVWLISEIARDPIILGEKSLLRHADGLSFVTEHDVYERLMTLSQGIGAEKARADEYLQALAYDTAHFDRYIEAAAKILQDYLRAEAAGLYAPLDALQLFNGWSGSYGFFLAYHPDIRDQLPSYAATAWVPVPEGATAVLFSELLDSDRASVVRDMQILEDYHAGLRQRNSIETERE